MRRKLLGIFVCMLLLATAVTAAGMMKKNIDINKSPQQTLGIEWEKTYGGSGAEKFWTVEETDDGYIACGTIGISNHFYPWIVKVDSAGVEEWNWTITEFFHNGTNLDIEYCWCDNIHQINDGGYITAISFHTLSEQYVFGGMVKLDSNGVQEWIEILAEGFNWTIWLEEIIVVNDGYIGVGAYGTHLRTDMDYSMCMCKTNTMGELQWYKEYIDYEGFDAARGFDNTNDGGYIICGESAIDEGWEATMVKTDSNGDEEWNKTFGGSGVDWFNEVFQTSDGGYMLGGGTNSYGVGSRDAWLVRTDSNGNEIWNKTYGEASTDSMYDFDSTEDGGYVLPVIIDWGSKADSWVVKTDADGNIEWKEIYGGMGAQFFIGISSTNDSGCIVSGVSGLWDVVPSDALLIKYSPFPKLETKIKGGLGVKVVIKNNGTGDAEDVYVELHVEGGILRMINKTVNKTVDIIAGDKESVSTGILLGFGPIKVTATVGDNEETKKGLQLFVLSIV